MRHGARGVILKKPGLGLPLICVAFALPACSVTETPGNGDAVMTIDMPGHMPQQVGSQSVLPGDPVALPTNLTGPTGNPSAVLTPPPQGIMPPSGAYAGVGRSLNDPGGQCSDPISITNWTVMGDRVSFGGFQGRIAPDGSLNMQLGGGTLSGRFAGPRFQGRTWYPAPACNYGLTLTPA
jgi:hypothetical protein